MSFPSFPYLSSAPFPSLPSPKHSACVGTGNTMECAAKGGGSLCGRGPPTRRCGLCGAVAYCSKAHQMSHWDDHKAECARLAQQMRHADVLNDFPFTFSEEVALLELRKQEMRCSILKSMGLHKTGLWKLECSCSPSVVSSKSSWLIKNWDLPSSLCPCLVPRNPLSSSITSWKDYYQWRCLPFHSPVSLLLHWPLTIYHCVHLSAVQGLISGATKKLHVHYLGPEKELFQLGVLGELKALFPAVQLHMEFVGPSIPQFRDGEMVNICNYLHCSENGCCCKDSPINSDTGVPSGETVTVKLNKGFYHDRYRDIVQESYPQLIVAANAGIAAYSSWSPTIELIKEMGIPAVFTDYCEEAALLAAQCIKSVTGQAPRIPVQINPFRQPMMVEDSALYLPCYSNCFLFGM